MPYKYGSCNIKLQFVIYISQYLVKRFYQIVLGQLKSFVEEFLIIEIFNPYKTQGVEGCNRKDNH